jgi:hypothetical protein
MSEEALLPSRREALNHMATITSESVEETPALLNTIDGRISRNVEDTIITKDDEELAMKETTEVVDPTTHTDVALSVCPHSEFIYIIGSPSPAVYARERCETHCACLGKCTGDTGRSRIHIEGL